MNCQRSEICTIRPNLTTKLNSDSKTSVRISKESDLNGVATAEYSTLLMAASVRAPEPDSHCAPMLHAPISIKVQNVRNPLQIASALSV